MYIVTGGAGFIGSNIVAALEKQGKQVVVCDWLEDGDKWRNLRKRALYNVIAPEKLFDFLNDEHPTVDAVIHMGAISSTMETDVDKIIRNNFTLSLDLWKWCAEKKVPFIYASSAATYGDGEEGFKDVETEEDGLGKLRPLNAYGWSKHLFDRRVARQIENGDVCPPQWAGLKFFNVYGPNEYHKGKQQSVVSHIFPTAKKKEGCTLFRSHHPDYEDGGQMRDFVWVGDCVNVIMWLLENPSVSGLFNVGSGKARSFKDLATAVYDAMGYKIDISYVDTPISIRDKYQYFTEADMSKLRALGYDTPSTALEDGIAQYVQDYLTQEDPYR